MINEVANFETRTQFLGFIGLASNKNRFIRSIVFAFVFLLSIAPAYAQKVIEVKIAAETSVENEIITLKDVAIISKGESSELLQSISLGYAPNVGMTREISRERIVLSIKSAGFSDKDFSLNAPKTFLVRRIGQQINGDVIREAVEKSISDYFSKSRIDARIVRLDLPEKLDAPIGSVEVRTGIVNVANPFAPFSLPVEVRINERSFSRFSANVEIEAFGDVLIAVRDLVTNSKLSPEDVSFETRRLEKPLINYLFDPANLRGMTLIKNLSNGTVLTTDSFINSVVIKSGDLVKIVGESGQMQIIVSGEARSNGKIGDRIAVRNSQSKAIIQATVIDESTVKIFF